MTRIQFPRPFDLRIVGSDVAKNEPPPPAPSHVPDGRIADEPEMIAAMLRYRQYNADVNAWLESLEVEAGAGRITDSTHTRLHNAAVDKLHHVVGRFNRQVRIYKARQHLRLASGHERRH
jgi:hypothetical protein